MGNCLSRKSAEVVTHPKAETLTPSTPAPTGTTKEAVEEVKTAVMPELKSEEPAPLGITSSGAQITDEMVHVHEGAASGFGAGGSQEVDEHSHHSSGHGFGAGGAEPPSEEQLRATAEAAPGFGAGGT